VKFISPGVAQTASAFFFSSDGISAIAVWDVAMIAAMQMNVAFTESLLVVGWNWRHNDRDQPVVAS